jgi:hypothetical protein
VSQGFNEQDLPGGERQKAKSLFLLMRRIISRLAQSVIPSYNLEGSVEGALAE